MARVYMIKYDAVSVSTAITLMQLKAGPASTCTILRAWLTQSSTTTNAYQRIQLVRKSAAATVTSFTPLLMDAGDGAAKSVGGTAATGITASAEGTDADILYPDSFSLLNGWLYVPVPEERIVIGAGGIIGLKLPAAPGSATTFSGGIIFSEVGG